jgi:hypothetical protein
MLVLFYLHTVVSWACKMIKHTMLSTEDFPTQGYSLWQDALYLTIPSMSLRFSPLLLSAALCMRSRRSGIPDPRTKQKSSVAKSRKRDLHSIRRMTTRKNIEKRMKSKSWLLCSGSVLKSETVESVQLSLSLSTDSQTVITTLDPGVVVALAVSKQDPIGRIVELEPAFRRPSSNLGKRITHVSRLPVS